MTFPTEVADHHKANLVQKCIYLVSQFKAKNLKLWKKFNEQLKSLRPENSWDFYHVLLVEYQKLIEKVQAPKTKKKALAKKAPKKKVAKKAPAKKAVKKKSPAKKAVSKKKTKKKTKK